jgi:hypothetical protein
MNKPIFKLCAIKRVHSQVRGSIRVRPGTVLWQKPVSLPHIPVKSANAKKKGTRQ